MKNCFECIKSLEPNSSSCVLEAMRRRTTTKMPVCVGVGVDGCVDARANVRVGGRGDLRVRVKIGGYVDRYACLY